MTKYNCSKDQYYDKIVTNCQPCKDICTPPEIQKGICEIQCRDYVKSKSDNLSKEHSMETIGIIIGVLILGFVILVITLVIIVICVRKKKRTNNSNKPMELQQSPRRQMAKRTTENRNLLLNHSLREGRSSFSPSSFNSLSFFPGPSSSRRIVEVDYGLDSRPSVPHSIMDLGLVEDPPYQKGGNGSSLEGGSSGPEVSLRSSLCDPRGREEAKTFFQEVVRIVSDLPYVKRVCTSDSGVNVSVAREDFQTNELLVRNILAGLLPEHEEEISRLTIDPS